MRRQNRQCLLTVQDDLWVEAGWMRMEQTSQSQITETWLQTPPVRSMHVHAVGWK